MNVKRSYLRNNMNSEENTTTTTTTTTSTSSNPTRRQSRFSFYPIFSVISGGNHNNNNNNNSSTTTTMNTGKGHGSKLREDGEETIVHPISDTKRIQTVDPSVVDSEGKSSTLHSPYPCAFHMSTFEQNQDEDVEETPTCFNTTSRLGLNESSSLLSLSHHSLNSESMASHSLQDDDSMTGLEQEEHNLEISDEIMTRHMESLHFHPTVGTIDPTLKSSSSPPSTTTTPHYHNRKTQPEFKQNILQDNNKDNTTVERRILLEALEYLQHRRKQRGDQGTMYTEKQDTSNHHLEQQQVHSMDTTNQDGPRTVSHPKIMNTLIAPPPLYPSNKILYSSTKSRSGFSDKDNNASRVSAAATTPPPPMIATASKLEDRLLSPFVDIHQTALSSIPIMFRNTDKDMNPMVSSSSSLLSIPKDIQTPCSSSSSSGPTEIAGSLESQGCNKQDKEENDMDLSYFRHLHLAHPIHSQLYSSTPSSPYSKEVECEDPRATDDPIVAHSLFPITPTRMIHNPYTTDIEESEIKSSKVGWVQFTNEDSLNPFSDPVQLSPWKDTNKSSEKRFLEEKIEQCLETILLSILEESTSRDLDTSKDIIKPNLRYIGGVIEKSVSTLLQEYSTLDLFVDENKDLIDEPVTIPSPQPEKPVISLLNTIESTGNECSVEVSHSSEYENDDDVAQAEISRCDDINAMFDRDVSIESDDNDDRNISYDDCVLDERDAHNYSNTKVLGRLSSKLGGTTGVVLHNEEVLDEYDDDDLDSQQLNDIEQSLEISRDKDSVDSIQDYIHDSIELSKESPDVSSDSIDSDKVHNPDRSDQRIFLPDTIETLSTGMCKNPAAIMSAFSFDSFKNSSVKKDRNVVNGPLSLSFDDKDHITDSSLVRRLYGHLLPESLKNDKKKSGFSSWLGGNFGDTAYYPEPWDESDPDETGFIKHKVSQAQLQYLEAEYEQLVHRYESMQSPSSDKKKKKSSFSQSSVVAEDAELAFPNVEEESDTQIEESELKSSVDVKKIPSRRSHEDFKRDKHHPIHSLQTNPAFPSAKASGTGNVGDLEIYHLPIIYKAHQTGFEPTKDLVLQPGTIFAGQYYVQSELGGAAFSMTYRCIDMNSGKKGVDGEEYYEEVCLKVIKNNKDFFDQSLDEIKILELLRQTGRCNEHNIVEMKCFFYHKEHLVIVTELLRQNLFEFGKYIAENNEPQYFTRTRLCYIARQCLISLNFIHNMGLVHSDIKPENILLSSYSKARVKVIDFGSSCYLTDRQSSYIQSRSYRAPEVVLGLPYDGKIDIWSLGCVIAEMYTGQVTFQNESVVSMLSRIESICGPFPRHMIENGRVSNQFFTPNGLLFEKINNEQDSVDDISVDMDEIFFNVFQPKVTTLSSRLGLEAGLLERRRTNWEDDEKALFVDFIRKLLTIDPEHRPSAAQALEHQWILSGFNISEDDLIYPPAK